MEFGPQNEGDRSHISQPLPIPLPVAEALSVWLKQVLPLTRRTRLIIWTLKRCRCPWKAPTPSSVPIRGTDGAG